MLNVLVIEIQIGNRYVVCGMFLAANAAKLTVRRIDGGGEERRGKKRKISLKQLLFEINDTRLLLTAPPISEVR